ncbi:MAG: CRISPR-associated protein [Methylibium sp. NZG]|nr:MAG: CRISPR-associated protein [Methylibium sp. NZG]
MTTTQQSNTLSHKIDFAIIIKVQNANPNGDPLNGNRPRTDYAGIGEMTDVCIKRKVRDRLMERYVDLKREGQPIAGQAIFVQSDDRKIDGETSLKNRAETALGKDAFAKATKEETAKRACAEWFDVRAFGQVFAFKKADPKKSKAKKVDDTEEADAPVDADGVSIPIRGPVSIHSAFSVERVDVSSQQITKSVNLEGDGSSRASDTMGMKHRVDHGIYRCVGSMNPQLAERTLFSDADAEVVQKLLPRLFENDVSSARPDGSMRVLKVIWWAHNCKSGQYSSARVHESLKVNSDGSYYIDRDATPGLEVKEIDGF